MIDTTDSCFSASLPPRYETDTPAPPLRPEIHRLVRMPRGWHRPNPPKAVRCITCMTAATAVH